MQVFDEMVDNLRDGEILLADYDTGLQFQISYEGLTISDDKVSITVGDPEAMELLRAFMEIYITAREEPLSINYDDLLTGF